jgi:Spy/CpxP family protein refolding chaperone
MLRQLNLTDAQQEQIRALTEEQRSQTTEQSPERKLGELRRALHAAVFADAPDTAQIDQLRSGIVEAEAAALASRVELQLKIAQVLTPEQRKQARELTGARTGRARAEGPRGPRSGGMPHATRP